MERLRSLLRRTLPPRVRDIIWYWRSPDLRRATRAAVMVRDRLGDHVLTGPFSGMRYIRKSVGSSYPPKLLGTYEKELWELVGMLRGRGYRLLIDVGAAEGYYTVGFARIFTESSVVAFEAMVDTHAHLSNLAALNGVKERIDLRGWCGVEALSSAMQAPGPILIICDCEGGERELLDPLRIAALAGADILVELHDFLVPGTSDLLRERFSATHNLEIIHMAPRVAADWPQQADFVPADCRLAAMAEHRDPHQRWFFFSARAPACRCR